MLDEILFGAIVLLVDDADQGIEPVYALVVGRIGDPKDITRRFCHEIAQRTADGHLYLFYLAEQERPQTGIEGVHGHYFVESSCRLVDVILFGNLQQRVKIGA